MELKKLIGKISITAKYIPTLQMVKTIVLFEDRVDSIYYCWTFLDSHGSLIANKCLSISKKNIDIDQIDHAITHCKFSIDNYQLDRHKLFEVINIEKL